MISNRPIFSLNTSQKNIVDKYSSQGLQAADFIERDWFNDSFLERAFSMLVDKKKLSFEAAFLVLDKLDKDQAYGVLMGLSHEEVFGLTACQIDAYLKHGFSKSDLMGLSEWQIQVLIALQNDGIRADNVRDQHWLNSLEHVIALLYLMRVKGKSFNKACDLLKNYTACEVNAITYGIDENECKGLSENLIKLLIKRMETEGLKNRDELEGLNEYQQKMVERLYSFGLTSQMLKKQIEHTSAKFQNAFERLILVRGITIKHSLTLIAELKDFQVHGLAMGLNRDEVSMLNECQIEALLTCRTIKNELSAKHFFDKNWFNSKQHVDAFNHMLLDGAFTVEGALQELDGLTGAEARLVSMGMKRDEVIGLNDFQVEAICQFKDKSKPIQCADLHGLDWFNSDDHVTALLLLVKRNKDMNVTQALQKLKNLQAHHLKLLLVEDIDPSRISKLTPIQIEILSNRKDYDAYRYRFKLLYADWLTTKEHAELFKLLSSFQYSLELVKHFHDKGEVEQTLNKIKIGAIYREDLIELSNALFTNAYRNHSSVYASGSTLYSPSSKTAQPVEQAPSSAPSSSNCNIM